MKHTHDLSRRALSVLLALTMLLTCLSVGLQAMAAPGFSQAYDGAFRANLSDYQAQARLQNHVVSDGGQPVWAAFEQYAAIAQGIYASGSGNTANTLKDAIQGEVG